MKILHTSDWHVGKSLRGRSRSADHRAALGHIIDIAHAESVDLVVIAGDVFDSSAPSPEAERIVYHALLGLAESGAVVVVVAGNHDNPRRLEAVAPLLDLGRIVVAPFLRPADEGGVQRIEVSNGEVASLVSLPFLSQRYVVKADDLMKLDADQHGQKYAGRMKLIIEELTGNADVDAVNLVVSHLFVAGGVLGGGERSAHTIFEYTVPASVFPGHLHYVALGHLHRAQQIGGSCPIWYSGSPIQLDFGESDDDKGVLLVEAGPGVPATVEFRPLPQLRRLRTIQGSMDALEALTDDVSDDYLKVVVEEPRRPGLAAEVRELFPTAVDVVLGVGERLPSGEPVEHRRRLGRPPRELFAEYLAEQQTVDDQLLALFDELLDEIHAAHPA